MNVRDLKNMIANCDDDMPILICGVYGSEGIIERVHVETQENNTQNGRPVLIIESDICSG
jgi:hypothetical protein